MNPRVKKVVPKSDYELKLTFTNRELKIFDVKPYMMFGIFADLKNKDLFNAVKVCDGTVEWPGGQDFCPDTLYEEGKTLNQSKRILRKRVSPR